MSYIIIYIHASVPLLVGSSSRDCCSPFLLQMKQSQSLMLRYVKFGVNRPLKGLKPPAISVHNNVHVITIPWPHIQCTCTFVRIHVCMCVWHMTR